MGEALGRAGEEVAKPIGVVHGPDIELDIKKRFAEDKLCDKSQHSCFFF